MVSSKAGDFQEEHERELQVAVDEAEERATRELRAALKRLGQDKEDDKAKSLRNQKEVRFPLVAFNEHHLFNTFPHTANLQQLSLKTFSQKYGNTI